MLKVSLYRIVFQIIANAATVSIDIGQFLSIQGNFACRCLAFGLIGVTGAGKNNAGSALLPTVQVIDKL
jgi:hypothetical protein